MAAQPIQASPVGQATAPPNAAVAVRGVTKRFGKGAEAVTALEGIDLRVEPGEFVTLLGASGCGKSTLLSLIAGLDEPSAGTVQVTGGQPALMFQESALFPWLTARDNVELALRLRKVPKDQWRSEAERLLATVHLAQAADRRAHELSGGQRQRVALARSLAQGADVLLMDEPFAALDAITRDHLHSELVSLWQERGFAVVFVTHNVREAVRLGQRVVLLTSRPGRVGREWRIESSYPRALDDTRVNRLTREITAALREEITRHA